MNILNIEHVSKVFGEKVVLDDVSYGVHQGDKIGIIGINGTGKSTILKIIGGLEEPDSIVFVEVLQMSRNRQEAKITREV